MRWHKQIGFGDRIAELCGGAALSAGVAASALIAAPLLSLNAVSLAIVGAAAGAGLGWAAVRMVPAGSAPAVLPDFAIAPIEEQEPDLLLDVPVFNPNVNEAGPVGILRLFADGPTPGDLQERIESHLRGVDAADADISRREPSSFEGPAHVGREPRVPGPSPWGSPAPSLRAIPDVTDALNAALEEIRLSLRRAQK